MLTQRKDDVRTQAREASKETRPADTLNLDFQSPKLPLFKPPSLWYFVTLALANQYNCFLHFENGLNHGHCPRWPHRPTSTQRRNREIWGRKEGGGRKPPRSPALGPLLLSWALFHPSVPGATWPLGESLLSGRVSLSPLTSPDARRLPVSWPTGPWMRMVTWEQTLQGDLYWGKQVSARADGVKSWNRMWGRLFQRAANRHWGSL